MLAAIFRHIADPEIDRAGGRRHVGRMALHQDLSLVGRTQTEEDLGELGASGSHQPGEAEDLAAPDSEGDVAYPARAMREVADLERYDPGPTRRFGKTDDSSRPTIRRMRPARSTPVLAVVATASPSRRTVMRSAIAEISSSRCEM